MCEKKINVLVERVCKIARSCRSAGWAGDDSQGRHKKPPRGLRCRRRLRRRLAPVWAQSTRDEGRKALDHERGLARARANVPRKASRRRRRRGEAAVVKSFARDDDGAALRYTTHMQRDEKRKKRRGGLSSPLYSLLQRVIMFVVKRSDEE